MSKQRSTWKNTPEGKTVRRNNTAAHFSSRPVELIESPALRALSRHAHLALLRIELELRHQGGRCNGKLVVTTEQFIEYGIERRRIPGALRELEAVGIVVVTERGRGGNAEHHQPHRFRLNYLCGAVDDHENVTNSWTRLKTLDEAKLVARAAADAKDPHRVTYGRRNAAQNISQVPKLHFPGTEPVPENGDFPGTKPVPPSQVPNLYLLSRVSGEGEGDESTAARPSAANGHEPDPPPLRAKPGADFVGNARGRLTAR